MKNNKLKMEDIGEFNFIRTIQDACLFSYSKLIKGIGDDCAVIGPYEDRVFLISTDLLLEDVHFIMKKIPPEHLGEKAVNVNLSDIAAMGGDALHIFVSLAIPKQMSADTIYAVYKGIKTACKRHEVNILGGDTSASMDRLMINVTVVGEAPENEVLYRNGAKPGDEIYLTGTIGDSAAGLKLIKDEASAPETLASGLIKAHNKPFPFLKAGRMIAKSGLASSMIDLSDGLISDLNHICKTSRVGADLIQSALPLSDELKTLAKINRFDPLILALSGGEDYRLLVTVPKEHSNTFQKIFKKSDQCHIFRIGTITKSTELELIMPDKTKKGLGTAGFDHFHPPSLSLDW